MVLLQTEAHGPPGVCYIVFENTDQFRALAGTQYEDLFNQIYKAWRDNWRETFADLKSSFIVEPNEFLRHSFITAFVKGAEVIGFILITIFDLRLLCYAEQSYIQRFPEFFPRECRRKGVYKLASLEYLFVDNHWRKATLGASLGERLTVLGAKLAIAKGADKCLAVARKDRGVSSFLCKRGAQQLETDWELHNVKTDLLAIHPESFNFSLEGEPKDFEWHNLSSYSLPIETRSKVEGIA